MEVWHLSFCFRFVDILLSFILLCALRFSSLWEETPTTLRG